MKKFPATLLFCLGITCLFAQNKTIEEEIRKLEQQEVKAVLDKDTAMLLRLWDTDYVVHAPDNKVNFSGETTLDRPVLKMPRISFTREVEHIIIRDSVVFSMGSETVVQPGSHPTVHKTITRRFTNIWMRKDNQWKLMARHANIICQTNPPKQ